MRLRPLSFCFVLSVLMLASVSKATAGDQDVASIPKRFQAEAPGILLGRPEAGDPRMGVNRGVPLPDQDVCYTIRSYKVKPAERIKDGESGAAGYTTCELGSSYRIRLAEAPASRRK
jgi:hypothetical protein